MSTSSFTSNKHSHHIITTDQTAKQIQETNAQTAHSSPLGSFCKSSAESSKFENNSKVRRNLDRVRWKLHRKCFIGAYIILPRSLGFCDWWLYIANVTPRIRLYFEGTSIDVVSVTCTPKKARYLWYGVIWYVQTTTVVFPFLKHAKDRPPSNI